MSKLVLLTLWTLLLLSTTVVSAQQIRSEKLAAEISNFGPAPYHISLEYFGSHICNGVILNSGWILTSAHCAIIANPNSFSVRTGMYNSVDGELISQVQKVTRSIIHPEYSENDLTNDIALLKLEQPFDLDGQFGPKEIPLPPEGHVATGLATASDLDNEGVAAQVTTYEIVPDDLCGGSPSQICLRWVDGDTGCQGSDSTPVVCHDLTEDYICAVHSWGYNGCSQPPEIPGVWTQVSNYTNWILNIMTSGH